MDYLAFCPHHILATSQVRGFLYKEDSGQWVLANQPNIKSCCLAKAEDKVSLDGDFLDRDIGRAITVRGELRDSHLVHAEKIEMKHHFSPLLLGCVALFLLFGKHLSWKLSH